MNQTIARLAAAACVASMLCLPDLIVAKPRPAPSACDSPGVSDLLCRKRGSIWLAPLGSPVKSTPTKTGTEMRPGSVVHVAKTAGARARFGGDATCNLGGLGRVTELVTRHGSASTTGTPSMFWHKSGDAACWFSGRGSAPTNYFCKTNIECSVKVFTDGTTSRGKVHKSVASVDTPRARAAAVQAGSVNITHKSLELDFCAGKFAIDYVDTSGEHHRTFDAERGKKHVYVVIEETRVVTSTEPGPSEPLPEGATATTIANPDGSTTTTTTYPDGMVATVTAYPNGTTTVTTESPDGTRSSNTVSTTGGGSASAIGSRLKIIVAWVTARGPCSVFD